MATPVRAHGPDAKDVVDVTLDSRAGRFMTVIQRVTAEEIVCEAPYDESGVTVLPPQGSGGTLVWRAVRGLQQAPIIISTVTGRDPAWWGLRLAGEVTRCQRREFVRAGVLLPVQLTVADAETQVMALDLSEGGLRARVPPDVAVEVDDRVRLAFDIGVRVEVAADVRRVLPRTKERAGELGLRFLGLSEADANRIRTAVFTQLRTSRARGVG